MTSEGNGIGRLDGIPVFVPLTAVGDRCLVKIVKVHKSYCYGRLETLESSSPDRIAPDCAAFAQCGGCCYRHISYDSELRFKEQAVRDAFERLGRIHTTHLPILGSSRLEAYRNKAQFPVGVGPDGKLFAGFYAARSHRIIPCDGCRLHRPVFEELKQIVLNYANEHGISAYDEKTGKGLLRHICIRAAEQTSELMLMLVATRDTLPGISALIGQVSSKVPAVASIVINVNKKNTNVILGEQCVTVYGNPCITDLLCGRRIDISPLSFYQVNRDQAERLYRTAGEFAGLDGSQTLMDLYCGAGTIGLSMADRVRYLIGVEVIPQAVENARANAKHNGIKNAEFLCADAAEATRRLAEQGLEPDVVIVDPPRKGCALSVISDIAGMSPKRIVMISCNPATAARDCAVLEQEGYRVIKVQAVDMFPRTAHVECVILLERMMENADLERNT